MPSIFADKTLYTLCTVSIDVGLARTVYICTIYDRLFGELPAKIPAKISNAKISKYNIP
jgi:hypothetical protein